MESLLKSEVISDDVRRLLLEIMFAGVNHSLISQVHAMLPALTVIVPDKKLQLVCLALLLAGLNEPLKAAKFYRILICQRLWRCVCYFLHQMRGLKIEYF